MFLKQALDALQDAAQHPLAIGMYILLVAGWFLISWRVKRHRSLLRHLKKLPEKDRLKALELEMGPLPKRGINAEQWLRAREQVFRLARLGIICIAIIMVLGLTVFYYLQDGGKEYWIRGNVFLDGRPIQDAIIAIVGPSGEYKSGPNGAFQFQLPTKNVGDSLNFIISYIADYQELLLDTTVSAKALSTLKFNLIPKQIYPIAGQIVESGTVKTVANAHIMLLANRGQGTTNIQGYFRFPVHGKPYEGIEATVSHPDYETKTVKLTLSEENHILLRRKP